MSILSDTLLLLLLACIHGSIQKSDPESLTYKAAVVEMRSTHYLNDSAKTINDNAEKIVEFIELAADKNADIVVLPELSLTGLRIISRPDVIARSSLIPDPLQNYAPCTNFSIRVAEGLRRIACTAHQNDIYVVTNLLEKEVCLSSDEDCPSDGYFLYVTSATFDRKGKIIARYRKSNIVHDEVGMLDYKRLPEISTFDTDFGVTFGNIICFDIMFGKPWLILTRELNVTDIIYPSGWISIMPFMSTLQLLTGFAYIEDVNILTAAQNLVEEGYSGSSIYAGRQGVIASVPLLDDQESILVADVPKKSKKTGSPIPPSLDSKRYIIDKPRREGGFRSFRWIYDKLDMYESKVIDKNGYTEQSLSYMGIECEFKVNITNLSPPVTYRLLALDGHHLFGDWTATGMKACAIIHCLNGTIDSCAHVQNSSAIFHSIEVKASYVDTPRITLMPSTLGADMLPLKNWTFHQYMQNEHVYTTISSTAPTQNIITFGLWGRDFENDYLVNNSSSRISNDQ